MLTQTTFDQLQNFQSFEDFSLFIKREFDDMFNDIPLEIITEVCYILLTRNYQTIAIISKFDNAKELLAGVLTVLQHEVFSFIGKHKILKTRLEIETSRILAVSFNCLAIKGLFVGHVFIDARGSEGELEKRKRIFDELAFVTNKMNIYI